MLNRWFFPANHLVIIQPSHRDYAMNRLATLFLCAFLMTACSEPRPSADLILHSGKIVTLDDAGTIASAVAVEHGRIVAVGGSEIAADFEAAEVVDLEGRTVVPGFVDSHIHMSGNPRRYIDLTEVDSIDAMAALVAAKAAELGPGEWITGYGWSEDELAEGRRPRLDDLDRAAPDNPVILTRAGAHSAVCNSRAFALAGIDADTPDPENGVIERDGDGRLNGIIRERQDVVARLVPESPAEEIAASLTDNLRRLFALGITSIVQAADRVDNYAQWEAIYAAHPGELPRAAVQVRWEGPEAMAAFGRRTGDGDEALRLGAIKVFVDGGFTGPAAYTRLPYKGHGDYRGTLTMSEDDLRRIIREAHDAGWQLGIHAIGDAAIELAVDALHEALAANPRADHRHYLNHFTVMPGGATMDRMAADGVAITQQPNFTYTLEGRYVANLDGERLAHNNPLRTPMGHGVFVALSSDILPIGPHVGLYAAVTRKGRSGAIYGAAEALTMDEALRGYTRNGAWLTREESIKGSIEPGKLADLVVLSDDPFDGPPERLLEARVLRTYLGGRLVFER
jgi:predicted amidohydrolase YtcJ